MTDIASAARRVAEDIRQGSRPLADDMLALLPVLDAMAAGRDDAGRVERWARAIAVAVGKLENRWEWFVAEARAAIALADAERAAGVATGWAAYEAARDLYGRVERMLGYLDEDDPEDAPYIPHAERELVTTRTALDAAVRRLAGVADLE